MQYVPIPHFYNCGFTLLPQLPVPPELLFKHQLLAVFFKRFLLHNAEEFLRHISLPDWEVKDSINA